ncbi:MAG TPA: hypothetical protein VI339_03505 [Steroidobacteraceae bacterium]|nr:hypothetical protein [Steroidobacteraceae bacterium]
MTLGVHDVSGTQTGECESMPPNAQNHYEATVADLPLSCPMPSMSL